MANIPPRIQKQTAKNTAFEEDDREEPLLAPPVRACRTDIAMWCDQGKNEDQILAAVGGGVSREELKNFMAANNLAIKRISASGSR